MTLGFSGTGEVWMNIDPTEFKGLNRNRVAAALHQLACEKKELEYHSEDFYIAADQVLAVLEGK